LSTVSFDLETIDGKEYYVLNVKVLCECTTIEMGRYGSSTTNPNGYTSSNYTDYVGTYTNFICNSIDITIYGNTIGIDLTNETFEFGEGENPLAISGNELLQDGTTTKGDTTSKFIADNILNQYSNGKEKATLRCAIGNYFDENGEKKISIDNDNFPMEFSVGDEVIPMVYIGNNEEKFMSSKYGKPKKYEVASVKPYFDGACWQEIEIIEKNL
jgi:hypothetical protein